MSTEEATISEITDKTEDDANTTKNEVAKTATIETSNGDKTSSDGDKNLDVKDNPYILTPPPIESPPPPKKTPEIPTIVVGYIPRKVGRYNLRPNPRPNANPNFRMLDSIITEHLRSTQD